MLKWGIPRHEAEKVSKEIIERANNPHALSYKIFLEFQRYLRAAYVLDKHMTDNNHADLVGVAVILKGMALELLFKTLISLESAEVTSFDSLPDTSKEKLKGHNIVELFSRIDSSHQERLAQIFSEHAGVHSLSADELRKTIIEHAEQIFVTWRYMYEKDHKSLNIRALENLIQSTQKLIVQLKAGQPTTIGTSSSEGSAGP